MKKLTELKRHLRAGKVYRRQELAQWSTSVDRHLKLLVRDGTLTKLSGGIYLRPKRTVFGEAPATDRELVSSFLKDERFLLASPNAYNSLGVGTTQLYNDTVVYNHKRHGRFNLGGRLFSFRVRPHFPKTLTREFLLVDLVNNLNELAEDQNEVLRRLKEKVTGSQSEALERAAHEYGKIRAKKFFSQLHDSYIKSHA